MAVESCGPELVANQRTFGGLVLVSNLDFQLVIDSLIECYISMPCLVVVKRRLLLTAFETPKQSAITNKLASRDPYNLDISNRADQKSFVTNDFGIHALA